MDKPVDLEGIRLIRRYPYSITDNEWQEIQGLEREVFADSIAGQRTPDEIDHYLQWGDPAAFIDGRLDPEVAVRQGRLNPGEFARPVVVTAHEGKDLVGYTYLADNTTPPLEKIKMLTPPSWNVPKVGGKRYAWAREMAVHPDYQYRGIGTVMALLALEMRKPKQPVAVYTLSEMQVVNDALRRYGLNETGDQTSPTFGENSKPTTVTRWSNVSVGKVMEKILNKPGMQIQIWLSNSSDF